jgi:hypothetical protein
MSHFLEAMMVLVIEIWIDNGTPSVTLAERRKLSLTNPRTLSPYRDQTDRMILLLANFCTRTVEAAREPETVSASKLISGLVCGEIGGLACRSRVEFKEVWMVIR